MPLMLQLVAPIPTLTDVLPSLVRMKTDLQQSHQHHRRKPQQWLGIHRSTISFAKFRRSCPTIPSVSGQSFSRSWLQVCKCNGDTNNQHRSGKKKTVMIVLTLVVDALVMLVVMVLVLFQPLIIAVFTFGSCLYSYRTKYNCIQLLVFLGPTCWLLYLTGALASSATHPKLRAK